MSFTNEVGPKLSHNFLQGVVDKYDLGQITFWNPFLGGWTNINNHLKTPKGEFILRLTPANERQRHHVGVEIAVIKHLFNKGLPTAEVMSTKKGEVNLKSKLGDRSFYMTLFKFIYGDNVPYPSINQIKEMGRILAKTDQALADFESSQLKKFWRIKAEIKDVSEKILNSSVHEDYYGGVISKDELLALMRGDLRDLKKFAKTHAEYLHPTSIIHGDFHPNNIKFSGDNIVGIFDFENVAHAPKLIDLSICLSQFRYRQEVMGIEFMKIWNYLVSGYREITPLNSEEEHLALLLTSIWLWKQIPWTLIPPSNLKKRSPGFYYKGHSEFFLKESLSGIRELQDLRLHK